MKLPIALYILAGVIGGLIASKVALTKLWDLPSAYSQGETGISEIATPVTPEPQAQYSEPLILEIPSLDIKAKVEKVGLDDKGNMDVPTEVMNVAWFMYGSKPGEIGNAAITGHLDSPVGPAVFYKLSDLEIGDMLLVTDEEGKILEFFVTASQVYGNADFPIGEVFLESDVARLNLITCTGVFDRTTRVYSHKLVVYSELSDI
jgi:sortase A